MCKSVSWVLRNFQTIFTLGSVAFAVFLWFVTMNGIPVKVETLDNRLEKITDRVTVLERTMAQQSIQSEMILKSVYEIRGVLMNEHKRNYE